MSTYGINANTLILGQGNNESIQIKGNNTRIKANIDIVDNLNDNVISYNDSTSTIDFHNKTVVNFSGGGGGGGGDVFLANNNAFTGNNSFAGNSTFTAAINSINNIETSGNISTSGSGSIDSAGAMSCVGNFSGGGNISCTGNLETTGTGNLQIAGTADILLGCNIGSGTNYQIGGVQIDSEDLSDSADIVKLVGGNITENTAVITGSSFNSVNGIVDFKSPSGGRVESDINNDIRITTNANTEQINFRLGSGSETLILRNNAGVPELLIAPDFIGGSHYKVNNTVSDLTTLINNTAWSFTQNLAGSGQISWINDVNLGTNSLSNSNVIIGNTGTLDTCTIHALTGITGDLTTTSLNTIIGQSISNSATVSIGTGTGNTTMTIGSTAADSLTINGTTSVNDTFSALSNSNLTGSTINIGTGIGTSVVTFCNDSTDLVNINDGKMVFNSTGELRKTGTSSGTTDLFTAVDTCLDRSAVSWVPVVQNLVSGTPVGIEIQLASGITNSVQSSVISSRLGTNAGTAVFKVSLRGRLTFAAIGGSGSTLLFTLPVGLRPTIEQNFICQQHVGIGSCRVDIPTSGIVSIDNASSTAGASFCNLGTISFYAGI
jgi:hypothetical protein